MKAVSFFGINLKKEVSFVNIKNEQEGVKYEHIGIVRNIIDKGGVGYSEFILKTKDEVIDIKINDNWSLIPQIKMEFNWSGYCNYITFIDTDCNKYTLTTRTGNTIFKASIENEVSGILSKINEITDYKFAIELQLSKLKKDIDNCNKWPGSIKLLGHLQVYWNRFNEMSKNNKLSESMEAKLKNEINYCINRLGERMSKYEL